LGALLADGGVVAVAWVEPGVVGELGEDAFGDVVQQGLELLRVRGPADAAGELGITSAVNASAARSEGFMLRVVSVRNPAFCSLGWRCDRSCTAQRGA
jgi:hypothetical protein